MFEKVFHYKHYTKELVTGPLSPFLDEIAKIYFDRGHSRRSIRNKFIVLGYLSQWMRRRNILVDQLCDSKIKKFLHTQERRVVCSISDRGDIASVKLLMRFLREKGVVSSQVDLASSADRLLADFEKHLSNERGMSSEAVRCYKRFAQLFIEEEFGSGKMEWNKIDADGIFQFLLCRSQHFSASTVKLLVTCLRSFFRFLRFRGDINFDLANSVPGVPSWRAANLPYYLKADDLRKLLRSVDRSTSIGKRNYAILLLLSRLGLRACEVAGLSMEDLDWQNGEIVLHGKGIRKKRLPISNEIGEALTSYLKVRRRNVSTRKFFLRSFPPYEGFSKTLVGMIVRATIARAGLKPYKCGSHLLRHTAATEMLRKGASLTEIGMILGHRSVESTAIYAKVDFGALQTLARPWPLSLPVGGGR